jgi:hypothetical protein
MADYCEKDLQLMNVSGLSRDNVASHLQKYRMGLKRCRPRLKRSDPDPAVLVAAGASATAKEKHCKRSSTGLMDSACDRGTAELICGSDVEADQAREQAEARACEREGSNPNANEDSCGGTAAFNASGSDDGAGAGSDNRNSTFMETAAQSHGQGHGCNLPTGPDMDSRLEDGVCTHADVVGGVGMGTNGSREGSNTDGKGTGNALRASTGGTSCPGSGGVGSGTRAGARDAGNHDGKGTGNDLHASTGGTSCPGSGGVGSGTGAGARDAGNSPHSTQARPGVQQSPPVAASCADAS